MGTKFEREMQAQERRAECEKNIAKLEGMIQECRELQTVIPRDGKNVETVHEHEFIRSRIAWLHDMLMDEKRAHQATFEGNADDVLAYMER